MLFWTVSSSSPLCKCCLSKYSTICNRRTLTALLLLWYIHPFDLWLHKTFSLRHANSPLRQLVALQITTPRITQGKERVEKRSSFYTSVACWWNIAVRMFLLNTFGHVARSLRLPALAIIAVRLHTDSVFQRWQSTRCQRMPNAAPVCVAAVENPHTARLKVPGILRPTVRDIFLSNVCLVSIAI